MGKTGLYLCYFCIYSLAVLIVGKSSINGEESVSEYFTCRRTLSLPRCVCTFAGTWVSAITILSLTGSVYEDGLSVILYSVVPWFLGAFILATVSSRIYEQDIVTVPELFYKRYGSRGLQVTYGAIFIFVYVFYLVSQYKGFGIVASAVFNIPYPVGVAMVYLFIIYTTFGGYRSVVRTDVFHLILLLLGIAAVLLTVISKVGGMGELYRKASEIAGAAHDGPVYAMEPGDMLSLFGGRYTPLVSLSMFWGWGLGLAANPQYIVRVLSARDKRTAGRTVLAALLVLVAVYFGLLHIGLGLRVLVPHIDAAMATDSIFVRLINHELYGPWSGFFLFAVIGACISTANSQLLLIASSFSYDIVGGLSKKPVPEHKTVTLGRLAVLGGGTLAMILTLRPPLFTLSYGGDLWGIISILFFPPLYGTLLCCRITVRGLRACLLTGVAAIAVLYPLHYAGTLTMHPAMLATPLTAGCLWLFSREGDKA